MASCGPAMGQWNIPTSVILENYFWTRPGTSGGKNRISWINAEARLNNSVKLVGSYLDVPIPSFVTKDGNGNLTTVPGRTLQSLDESYVEVRYQQLVSRIGRFRSRFGLGDWSELFYTPIAMAPMVRNNPVNRLGLLRDDTGIDIDVPLGDFEVQAGLVDVDNDTWQIVPRRLDHGTLRIQWSPGAVMTGVHALGKLGGSGQQDSMIGFDVRWSSTNIVIRAEFDRGIDTGTNGEGGYVDVFFRPQGMFRTQFGLREEFYNSPFDKKNRLTTIGVRHILAPELVLTVNYGSGNDVMPSSSMRGWTVQLMTAVRF